jgi:hypothetical protein
MIKKKKKKKEKGNLIFAFRTKNQVQYDISVCKDPKEQVLTSNLQDKLFMYFIKLE